MDFYVDLAIAVLLRLLKDRRSFARYADALAKVYVAIEKAANVDATIRDAIEAKRES